MYYDETGQVKAAGVTVLDQNVIDMAEDEGWTKVEQYVLDIISSTRIQAMSPLIYLHSFKLQLRPASVHLNSDGLSFSNPAPFKTYAEVFGDFLQYLLRCTEAFIKDTHIDGPVLWNSVQHHADFVLSHPNGWGANSSRVCARARCTVG